MDDIRAELRELAHEAATHIERRDSAVRRARAAGMTWQEIGDILHMTPHGLRKALNKDQK